MFNGTFQIIPLCGTYMIDFSYTIPGFAFILSYCVDKMTTTTIEFESIVL